ncbi:MAG: hypothetical protein P1V97_24750 [Planctomycetota bacterium]|nr:hypothetical protein [Planctomycetota bacterium]
MVQETGQNTIKLNRPRCPYCHDDIQPELEKSGCSQCMAWFHTECWEEHGGCTSCVTPKEPEQSSIPNQQTESSTSHPPSIHNRSGYSLLTPEHKKAAHKVALKNGFLTLSVLSPLILIANILVMLSAQNEWGAVVLFYLYMTSLSFLAIAYSVTRQRQLKIELGKVIKGHGKKAISKELKK